MNIIQRTFKVPESSKDYFAYETKCLDWFFEEFPDVNPDYVSIYNESPYIVIVAEDVCI